MKKNLMVTGAGGFVGKNISEALQGQYNILSMTHRDMNLLNYNEISSFFNNHNIDVIVHCANTGGSRKTFYDEGSNNVTEYNLRMFMNIVSCMKPETKLINLGSGAEYDKSRELNKVKEEEFGVYIPEDSYGFSKYLISKYIENMKNVICLRIFGLYGKYEDYSYKFISNSIAKNILHLPIEINQNVIFDYLYIEDFLKIMALLIEDWPEDRFMNITPSESVDLITIAKIINSISGYKSEVIILNEGLNKSYTGDNSLLLRSYSNVGFTSYGKGIAELYNYYLSIEDTIDKTKIESDTYLKYCKINSGKR